MKRILFTFLFLSISQAQTFSWENNETILGSYGNLGSATNVDNTLILTEDPIDGTPSAYIAAVAGLNGGELIEVCVDMYTPNSDVKGRIWGHYYDGVDISSYDGTASGPSDYADTYGDWETMCNTWTVENGKVGFILEEKSEINANPLDSKDHPNGVWNLLPTLKLNKDQKKSKYVKIGESDRMTLRFIKPFN